MEAVLDFLQKIFGEGTDLAAVASGAGLFGGGASAAAVMLVHGAIKRFIFRTILTGLLTGGGFLFLLHYLGFQIVPPENLKERIPFGQNYDAPGGHQEAKKEDEDGKKGARIYYVKSPFAR